MGFSSIMNPQYAALRALGIPTGHHDATRFVYFWAPPKTVCYPQNHQSNVKLFDLKTNTYVAAFPTGGGCIDAGYQNAVGAGQFQVPMAPCTAPLWSPQAGVGGAFLVTIANVLNNPPICYIASPDNLCAHPRPTPAPPPSSRLQMLRRWLQ
jgi:hypothetical protein